MKRSKEVTTGLISKRLFLSDKIASPKIEKKFLIALKQPNRVIQVVVEQYIFRDKQPKKIMWCKNL